MTTKIVLIIFTTANDSPNLAQCLFDGFNDLENENIKISQKNITLARAPTLRKNPVEPPWLARNSHIHPQKFLTQHATGAC